MQKYALMQNKPEKASVSQHCYPKSDIGEKRQQAVQAALYTKASTKLLLKGLHLLLIQKLVIHFHRRALPLIK
jgi:hypothetical protein